LELGAREGALRLERVQLIDVRTARVVVASVGLNAAARVEGAVEREDPLLLLDQFRVKRAQVVVVTRR
jgi:hypothetical protein